jgi:hypothetical protein
MTRGSYGSPDNLLSGWRSEAKPQEVTEYTRIFGDLLCVRAGALPHPDNKLSGLPSQITPLKMKTLSYLFLAAFLLLPARAADTPILFSAGEGGMGVATGDSLLLTLRPTLANAAWEFTSAKALPGADSLFPFEIASGGKIIDGDFQAKSADNGAEATWTFTAKNDVEFETLVVEADISLSHLVGGQWTADAATGTFPARFGGAQFFVGKVKSLKLDFPDHHTVSFAFPQPTLVVLQDDRQWGGSTFTLRIGRDHARMAAGETYTIAMNVTSPEGLAYSPDLPAFMKPVTLAANDKWVPLKEDDLDIVPGSALDFSGMGFTQGPVKERIVATPDGHFASVYLDMGVKRRFYGVNFCFDTSYLPKEEADRLLDRMVRLGYNAVRIHHYEAQLTSPTWQPNLNWDPAKVDQLDYLMAGCAKRGIYITTDLFVSRPISGKAIGLPQYDEAPDNRIAMDRYKILVLVNDAAFQDWCAFARKFLDRVNPYTGVRVADDPTVAWISLINEGPVSNAWGAARVMPEWTAAWNKWLAARFTSRDALVAALGSLEANEDLQKANIALPQYLNADTPRGRLAEVFVTATEKAAYERMRDFVRKDLKCPALLTNMNDAGPEVVPLAGVRADFDYVDNHFYVDHPRFLQKAWNLPSFCSNANPVAAGAPGGTSAATTRLYGKPFTLTEFDYAGPSRFRAVGGPLTGAMASLQDWDALWHFDYSGTSKFLFTPGPLSYFDLVSDPLAQAADRIGLLLFLRGDVAAAPDRLAMVFSPKELEQPAAKMSLAPLQAATWRTGVGGLVVGNDALNYPVPVTPVASNDPDSVTAALSKLKLSAEEGAPIRSDTGEITLAPTDGVLTIDTPRSAGGFANAGKAIDASKAGVRIDGVTTDATIFVNSLDSAPIRNSKRLLVTHLTDLQDTGAKFGEGARQTLQARGGVPHLVLDGAATVHVALDDPSAYTVWALATNGKRLEKIDAKTDGGQLTFTASVRGADGARMLYEIAR